MKNVYESPKMDLLSLSTEDILLLSDTLASDTDLSGEDREWNEGLLIG